MDQPTDQLTPYRQAIQQVLSEHAYTPIGDIQTELIFDRERDHYQIVQVGWSRDGRRVYGCSIHLDLIGSQVWLQHNATEIDVAEELIAQGVDSQDIVLGFIQPSQRKYTAYADA